MIDYSILEDAFKAHFQGYDFSKLRKKAEAALDPAKNSRLADWMRLSHELPAIRATHLDFNKAAISIQTADGIPAPVKNSLRKQLKQLRPWRKGPYELFGIYIDTEWRSDWKWERLVNHLPDLSGCKILDVGCGNGYHCWKSYGASAKLVIGIDPYLLSVVQFHALKQYTGSPPVFVLPLAMQELPSKSLHFDVVFSMGVLYHQRSPLDHLFELREILRPGGLLILESLAIEENRGQILIPDNRYAKMRNVWMIPSCSTLEKWLRRCGFKNCRFIDMTKTTIEEQHSTDWMTFESLPDFLDPRDQDLTIEGYPAPRRAIFFAEAP
jgi:tRNA (mo5U34)-methyltransferase